MTHKNNPLAELQETLYTSKNPTRRWLHQSRRSWITEAINSVIPTNNKKLKHALEVGPGAGGYLPILKELADQVVAADIESAYLDYVKEKFSQETGVSYLVDDITDSTQPENSYELILCTEVIEHISDSQAALEGLHRLLKPDAILILSTPQRYSPLELAAKIAFLPGIIQIVRLIYGEAIIETGHINLLTENQLKKQLYDADFTIEKQYKCGFYIPLIAEFSGNLGLNIEKYIERIIRGSFLDNLLWTQCYILRAKKS